MTTETTTAADWIAAIGQPAIDALRELVDARDCDYDRLNELRDGRDEWNDGDDCREDWATYHTEDAAELAGLDLARGDCGSEEDAQQRIDDDPLEIQVGGWWAPFGDPYPTEYRILLTTGGPAVRIVGDLGEHGEPCSARLEVQDWFKQWTEFPANENILLRYASSFAFAE